VYIDLQRRMSPSQKLQQAFEWSETIGQFAEGGLRQRYPNADDREIFLRTARMKLGPDLFRKAYGDVLPNDRRTGKRA